MAIYQYVQLLLHLNVSQIHHNRTHCRVILKLINSIRSKIFGIAFFEMKDVTWSGLLFKYYLQYTFFNDFFDLVLVFKDTESRTRAKGFYLSVRLVYLIFDSEFFMTSLDIDFLFTNISHEETIETCINILFENTERAEGLSKTEFFSKWSACYILLRLQNFILWQ